MVTSTSLIEIVIPPTSHVGIVFCKELFLILFQTALIIYACHLVIINKALNQDSTFAVGLFGLYEVYYLNHLCESFFSLLEFENWGEQDLHMGIRFQSEYEGHNYWYAQEEDE